MKHAVRKHLRDFAALLAMIAIGVGVGAYILANQRLHFPFIDDDPYDVWVEVENARGVIPGQGQTVRVSGMRVGDIGDVELNGGRARLRMDLDDEHAGLVRTDATVLLRPRTGLKDMFIALDPGTGRAPAVPEGGEIDLAASDPDVNPDEVLAMLDGDTRDYLKLLINGAGKGLRGRGNDLREVLYRLGPLHRDLAALNREVVKRRRNLAQLVHDYGSTVGRLGREDRALAALVTNASRVFGRLSREDRQISEAVSRLPSTLRRTESALAAVRDLGEVAGPAFEALRPAVRQIDDANSELRPLGRTAEPIVRREVRPFARAALPYLRDLGPAGRDLSKAAPDLKEAVGQLNRFFNIAAYNPNGRERLTGDVTRDRAREEGFLFHLGWTAHNSNSIFSTADASGPFRRTLISATCTTYQQLLLETGPAAPLLRDILGLKTLLADTNLCPPS